MWLVCFTGRSERTWWWDKIGLTSLNFRHCYVCQYQADQGKWVLLDWRTGLCDVIVFDSDEMEYILGQLSCNQGSGILFKARMPERQIQYRVPLIYCVQAVLQVLGLPTKWTFTPQQLYKRLIRAGGEEIVNNRSESNGKRKQTRFRSSSCTDQPANS